MVIWMPSRVSAPTALSVSAVVAESEIEFSSASKRSASPVFLLVSLSFLAPFDSSSSMRKVAVEKTRLSGGLFCASSGTSLTPPGRPHCAQR
jgi:hypothetical protein